MINKNNAPDVIAKMLRRMVVTATKSRGGGVNLVSALLASEISGASRSGSRYGLSVG